MLQVVIALLVFTPFVLADNDVVALQPVADSLVPHHTNVFRCKEFFAIVRRGLPFQLAVTTAAPLSPQDNIVVSLSGKPLPSIVTSVQGTTAVVTVNTTAAAAVGAFQLSATTVGGTPFSPRAAVAVLFNPYLPSDDVYMEDPSLRAEYVENESGVLWLGSLARHSAMAWAYAQFNDLTLVAAMHLLASFDGDAADVRAVARHLSFASTYQQANAKGMLVGNWGSSFAGGTPPTSWQGSDQLIKQYVTSGYKPVKFAQCWVFAGVLNSLLRALGVPSRQLTTFNSAHESPDDGRYTHVLNNYYDETGKLIQQDGSVWNFHSWNDVWMARPDLGAAYGGWQAVDATPQELSGGVFQMGPASVKAVLGKADSKAYDTPFVVSEVAAVVHNYLVRCSSGTCKIVKDLGVETDSQIAALVATKTPRTQALQDITAQYHAPTRLDAVRVGVNKVALDLLVTDANIGRPLNVDVTFSAANGTAPLNFQFEVHGYYTTYTGKVTGTFRSITAHGMLSPDNNFTDVWTASIPQDYTITPLATNLMFSVMATVVETGDVLIDSDQFTVAIPKVLLSASNTTVHVSGPPATLTASYPNPVPGRPLTSCTFLVHAPEIPEQAIPVGTIAAGATWSMTRALKPSPSHLGRRVVITTLACNELHATGFIDLMVVA